MHPVPLSTKHLNALPLQSTPKYSIASSFTPLAPLTPPAPKISQLAPAARREAALNHALKYLARYNVSTADLFLYIFSDTKDDDMHYRRSRFLTDGVALETLLDRFKKYAPGRVGDWMGTQCLPIVEKKITKEMDVLKKEWKFGVNDVTSSFISGSLDLGLLRTTIERSAPTVWHLITTCAQTDRAFEENKLKTPDAVCFSFHSF
jgi:hypothetical protein